MAELDIEIETTLREQAIAALEAYFREVGPGPVTRSQIHGLLHIAVNEPGKVADFAGGQKTKAEKRGREAEGKFWDVVSSVCKGSKSPLRGHHWSLKGLRDASLPTALNEPAAAGTSREEQEANRRRKRDRVLWDERWQRDHVGPFFRHFAAHYLYRLPPGTR